MTDPTIHEAHRRVLHTAGSVLAREFLAAIYDGSTSIISVEPGDINVALGFIDRHADCGFTLTDATSMAVMVRLQVARVFSFDSDFLVAGFLRFHQFSDREPSATCESVTAPSRAY